MTQRITHLLIIVFFSFNLSSCLSIKKENTTDYSLKNDSITVYQGTIAGNKKILETTSCTDVVNLIKNKIAKKPTVILDGGYTVFVKNYILSSENGSLQSWLDLCSERANDNNKYD